MKKLRAKFDAIAATSKSGKPMTQQLAMNGMLQESHSYDHNRPKRAVVSRYK